MQVGVGHDAVTRVDDGRRRRSAAARPRGRVRVQVDWSGCRRAPPLVRRARVRREADSGRPPAARRAGRPAGPRPAVAPDRVVPRRAGRAPAAVPAVPPAPVGVVPPAPVDPRGATAPRAAPAPVDRLDATAARVPPPAPTAPEPLRPGAVPAARRPVGVPGTAARGATVPTPVPIAARSSARAGAAWPGGAPARCATGSSTAPTRTPPRDGAGGGPGRTSSSPRSSSGSTTGPAPPPGRPRPPAHRPVREPAELPADIAQELATAAGPDWNFLRARVSERMAAGIGAYERERYRDAARILSTVVEAVPNAPSARELLGLSQYHQGNWKAALPNLEMFATLTGSVDQHPVRMDCHRALGRPKRVEALFEELRKGSPDPEVLSEGRLVLAGTRADLGDLTGPSAPGRRRRRPPGEEPGRAAPAPVVRAGRPHGALGRPGPGPGAVPPGPGRRSRRLRRGRPAGVAGTAAPGPTGRRTGPAAPGRLCRHEPRTAAG